MFDPLTSDLKAKFLAPSKERERLSDGISQAILKFIISDGLKPGDALPSERELAGYFQVSRIVVREAIRSLNQAGVIQTRQGKGSSVKAFDGIEVEKQLCIGLTDDRVLFTQLMELRVIIETGAVDLLLQRATDQDWARMSDCLSAMRRAAQSGWPIEEHDLAFHRELLQATHNDPISRLSSVLSRFFRIKALCLPPLIEFMPFDEQIRQHEAIYEALRRGEASVAKQGLRDAILESESFARAWDMRAKLPMR